MERLDYLLKIKRISRLVETEKPRYLDFFSNSYRENLEHCKFVIENFPRWSIISGYYAMHDMTKLFLADKFSLKIEFNVHQTTLEVLEEVLKDKEVITLLKEAYKEFLKLLNDLAEAKSKRTKAQYYTGASFLKKEYAKEAQGFYEETVLNYLNKIKLLKDAI